MAFNTPLPQNPLAFVLIVITGIIVFAMAGIAFTAFIPNADSGPAVVQLPFLTLQFISGVFFPFTSEPAFLKTVANIFPLRWLLDAIRAGYLGFDYFHTKRVVTPASVGHAASVDQVPASVHGLHAIGAAAPAYLNLAVWFVVFAFIARTRFRWEKRASWGNRRWPPSATPRAPTAARQPRRARSSFWMTWGFALPCEARTTWPTKNPSNALLPARY